MSKPDYMPKLTPIQRHGNIWLKRDDLFTVAGVSGGKVRSCWQLSQRAKGLVTAGSRFSPQANIVAHIAHKLAIPCRVHTPTGPLSPELLDARAHGAEIIQHPAGYNNVIVARALADARKTGWTNIPFGMECQEAVHQTFSQVASIPEGVKRIVVPVGSGMSLAGILWGLSTARLPLPVLGVRVGADPTKRLNLYAPHDWRRRVTLVTSDLDYHSHASVNTYLGVTLDPVYEAKCLPFLRPGDLFWIVGIRATA